MALIFNL